MSTIERARQVVNLRIIATMRWTLAGLILLLPIAVYSETPVHTPMDLPIAKQVTAIAERVRGGLVVMLPTMGGSAPLETIEEFLGTHTIIIPIANFDDNQHAANENLRLQNLWDAIDLMAALEADDYGR